MRVCFFVSSTKPADILATNARLLLFSQYHNLQPANCITVATSTEEDDKDVKPTNTNLPAVVILDNRHPQQMTVSSAMHYLQENPSTRQCQRAEKIIVANSSPILNSSCTSLTTLQPQTVRALTCGPYFA